MKLSLVVPTYEERANLGPLVIRLAAALPGYEYEIVVVDDDSPDGTAEEAAILANRHPITVIKREGVRGLGSAILEGFRNSRGDVLGVIDADLQHPPEVMLKLVKAIGDGADIAIASRHVPGGGIENWTRFRRLVSRGATILARPLTGVRDPMSGCFMLDRVVIEGVNLSPKGYKLLMEILVKGRYSTVREVPYTFGNRHAGKSKLSMMEYARHLTLLITLYSYKIINPGGGPKRYL